MKKNKIGLSLVPDRGRFLLLLLGISFFLIWRPDPVSAYVGPGAGFAFVSSFFILFIAFILALFTLATWPFRWLFGMLRSRKALGKSRVKRVIILGLDGQDPELTERFMNEGLLPNFARLKEQGSYHRLATTLPAESPVAWSSFQTGCNPGKHRIFDFFVPERSTYLPRLASAEIGIPRRFLPLGPYRIPLGKPRISFYRKSESFWKTLGKNGIFSTVLRVPVSFPPEKFRGLQLSAMSVPDLNGTQGTFTFYTTSSNGDRLSEGKIAPLEVREDGLVRGTITGPPSPLKGRAEAMTIPFDLKLNNNAKIRIQGKDYPLVEGDLSSWIPLKFPAGLGIKVNGMCRFLLRSKSPDIGLYMSPLNIDPEKPALPISHPFTYSAYLAKTQGPFNTLGLSEDTWALNERILDEQSFLQQAYSVHQEREAMFFDAVEKTDRGLVVCVFDITDRLQHMFWRYLEKEHPANRDKDVQHHREAIRKLYCQMDELVGRLLDKIDSKTVLMVMSDHGFKSFQYGVNLNSWLYRNGLLALQGPPSGKEWLEDVEWSATQAYSMGLGGIYLNVKGREGKGIVNKGPEVGRLKQQIIDGLQGLVDEERGTNPVRRVYDTAEAYQGPYVAEAPDLIVGFAPGYRVSWESAKGAVTDRVFSENTKSWSGDHCVNPPDVPGILFSNRSIDIANPSIVDIGPTVLDLFGVSVPAHCDGTSLMPESPEGADVKGQPAEALP